MADQKSQSNKRVFFTNEKISLHKNNLKNLKIAYLEAHNTYLKAMIRVFQMNSNSKCEDTLAKNSSFDLFKRIKRV